MKRLKIEKHPANNDYQFSFPHLSKTKSLCRQFENFFPKTAKDLSPNTPIKLPIKLEQDQKTFRRIFGNTECDKRKEMKNSVQGLSEAALTTPIHSNWAAPSILDAKLMEHSVWLYATLGLTSIKKLVGHYQEITMSPILWKMLRFSRTLI